MRRLEIGMVQPLCCRGKTNAAVGGNYGGRVASPITLPSAQTRIARRLPQKQPPESQYPDL
jgi:hypothetical protein